MAKTLAEQLHEHRQCVKYERVLRRLRQRIFEYEDTGPAIYAKARRLMALCKDRCRPQWARRQKIQENRHAERVWLSGGAISPRPPSD